MNPIGLARPSDPYDRFLLPANRSALRENLGKKEKGDGRSSSREATKRTSIQYWATIHGERRGETGQFKRKIQKGERVNSDHMKPRPQELRGERANDDT